MKITYTLTFTLDSRSQDDTTFLGGVSSMLAVAGIDSDLTAVVADDPEPAPDLDSVLAKAAMYQGDFGTGRTQPSYADAMPKPRERHDIVVRHRDQRVGNWDVFNATSCPLCKAHLGRPCIKASGDEALVPHVARTRAYLGEPQPEPKARSVKEAQAHYNDAWIAVHSVECPRCGAQKGDRCTSTTGREINVVSTHRGRIALVQ